MNNQAELTGLAELEDQSLEEQVRQLREIHERLASKLKEAKEV